MKKKIILLIFGILIYAVNINAAIIHRVDKIIFSDFTEQITAGTTQHIALSSTGTLTHSQIDDKLALLDGSTTTLSLSILELESSTSTLEGSLNTEISDRISEDNLISDATGQIRIDFEAYDSTLNDSTTTLQGYIDTLWSSTSTLETATGLNTIHRTSDGSDHTFINQDVTINSSPILDGTNFTGIANTQNEPLYQIIVATYSGTGIDYGCNGTDDDVCINAAIVEANGIGVVFIKGGTYVLTSTITVNVANTNIISQNAIFTWDASVTTDMNMVQISSANVIIDGLTLSGAGDDNWEQGFFFIAGGNYGTLKTCLVKDVTTGEAVYKTWGTNTKIVNCIADNCDGDRSLYVAATLAYINGFIVLNSDSYISSTNTNGSFYNIVVYNSGDNIRSVNFSSDKNIFSGFIIKYADGIGIRNTGDFNCFSNGTMDDVDNAGVFLAGDGNTVTGINFRVIGTAGGNAQNGIDVIAGSNDTTLSNLTFSSTVDKYVIEVSATATNTKISNISFNEITGNIGTIVDLSGVSSIVNCYPVPNQLQSNTTCYRNLTVNGYIQFKSSTTAGLQGTTPTALGQTYWNTDTNELWISTGTSINDFIQK